MCTDNIDHYIDVPTKICIKSVPYLHKKSDNWVLNMVFLSLGVDDSN